MCSHNFLSFYKKIKKMMQIIYCSLMLLLYFMNIYMSKDEKSRRKIKRIKIKKIIIEIIITS